MRGLLFVVALAGCTHAVSNGPAWPKERAGGEGGESLAPREAAKSIEVAIENDGDDKPAQAAAEKPAEKPASVTEAAPPAAAAPATTDEPIQTEEIVIEVGGDD